MSAQNREISMDRPRSLGELKASGYQIVDVKTEMRRNLIRKLQARRPPLSAASSATTKRSSRRSRTPFFRSTTCSFSGCAARPRRACCGSSSTCSTTRSRSSPAARSTTIRSPRSSRASRERLAKQGDDTPIEWIGRERRYHEKLATPDVTIADLIGEIDMIKHAEGRYLSERTDDALRPDPAQPIAASSA